MVQGHQQVVCKTSLHMIYIMVTGLSIISIILDQIMLFKRTMLSSRSTLRIEIATAASAAS